MVGNNSTFNENKEFIDNLVKTIPLEVSSLNAFNTLLDTSTTMFITKKLYGYKEAPFFNFDEKQNLHLDLQFGYHNEILGKNILTINFQDMYYNTNTILDTSNVVIDFVCETNLSSGTSDKFSLYELNTWIEYDNKVVITNKGLLESPFYKKI